MKNSHSNGLYDFCQDKSNIVIYGSGVIGQITARIIIDYGINFDCFIISDNQENSTNEICGKPIYKISDCRKLKQIDAIVVAVSDQYWNEIEKNIFQNKLDCVMYYVTRKDYNSSSVGILDTRISAENHGNEIIMESVDKQIFQMCKKDFIYRFPFLDNFEGYAKRNMELCQYLFLGGTNALNSEMDEYKYIGVNEDNISVLQNKIVLVGVGWEKYDKPANDYTKYVLKKILAKNVLHSVRDEYTKKKLEEIGIKTVINTGCCTLWNLNKKHCEKIPRKKADNALVMLTPIDWKMDNMLIHTVEKNYKKVYFWAQGPTDYWYIKSICPSAIHIPYQLADLNKFLNEIDEIDYVGTRLHGGIKCLQNCKRSIIFSLDNRAREMRKDFNLPVWEREEINQLEQIIHSEFTTDIRIPINEIIRWKSQFAYANNMVESKLLKIAGS